jgi:hypothetical protein
MVPDATGRFRNRPFYEDEELDDLCEQIVLSYMDKRGKLVYPIPTNDLLILLEREAQDLDTYADLSGEGESVEGVTDFFPGKKPKVRIAKSLSNCPTEHRLRTTLAHEFGHAKFHAPLYDQFALRNGDASPRCKRENIVGAAKVDWMEWQAGYVCGALLMPIGHLNRLIGDFMERHRWYGQMYAEYPKALQLIELISTTYNVSLQAARVRLLVRGVLSEEPIRPFFR